ncbi:MAG TPA: CoA transferase [Candidatus Dormibacteraeota bacterium]|jgi:crotonobetainyl-CoA:carnitine CoA-transferase CaiB-like acyl-CoA transferase
MRPLADVRIVAVEQYGAGPYGSVHLADLGAEVIKVEDPGTGGDVGRYVPPYQEGEDSLFFETFNRNKRSLSLDISTAAGRGVFEDLVRQSDAVYSNLRGDIPDRLRIRHAHLKHLNPRIVCCSLSGFGMDGPRRAEPGYDYLVQGLAGWMSLTGEPGGPPTKSGLSLVDFSSGLAAALALMAGIHAARRDGTGMDCDVSLFEVALSMLSYPATWYLTTGHRAERTALSAHPSIVPFQNFRTGDGWIVVVCAKEKFWKRLTEALGRPQLATDARFADFGARLAHRGELLAILEPLFGGETTADLLDRLADAGVPCAPVNDLEQAFADPQALARGVVVETAHPRFGTVRQVASPLRVGAPQGSTHRRAPARHEDSAHVFGLLGYDPARVLELGENGAFGPAACAVDGPH